MSDGVKCIICFSDVKICVVGSCDHRVLCHECAVRLRFIFKDTKCVMCKSSQDELLFTKSSSKRLSAREKPRLRFIKSLNAWADPDIASDVRLLTLRRCPLCVQYNANEEKSYKSTRDLTTHIEKVHGMKACITCLKGRKVLPHQQRVYTAAELKRHLREGDPAMGEDGPIAVHPRCKFCKRQTFFGSEDLSHHMRERHFVCQVCLRHSQKEQFFRNYDSLRKHFERDHYFCHHSDCLEKRFVVFGSKIEYNAHLATVHNEKSARLLSPSLFFSRGRGRADFEGGRGPRSVAVADRASEGSFPSAADGDKLKAMRQLARGKDIMLRIKRALEQDNRKTAVEKYRAFRHNSGRFREDSLVASEYARGCLSLFGHDRRLEDLFIEFVDLIPDTSKSNALRRAYDTMKIHTTKQKSLESEFPSLSTTNSTSTTGESDNGSHRDRTLASIKGKRREKFRANNVSSLFRYKHLPRRLCRFLLAGRRATRAICVESASTERSRRFSRKGDTETRELPESDRPEWTLAAMAHWKCKPIRSHRDLIPRTFISLQSSTLGDWQTCIEMFEKIPLVGGEEESAEDAKISHVAQWLEGSIQNFPEVDIRTLYWFMRAADESLRSHSRDRSSDEMTSTVRYPPGFTPEPSRSTTTFDEERGVKVGASIIPSAKSDDDAKPTGKKKKKKKKKKKGRVLDFGRR
eukprot:g3520.t1